MGRVVLHVGMPKTGTTSIQRWLGGQAEALLRERDVAVLQAQETGDRIDLQRYRTGTVNASVLLLRYNRLGAPRALLTGFFDQLADLAEQHEVVVLSGEDLAFFLTDRVDDFADGLRRLGERVPTTVAYYVRPQHTMLEALWQQSHFRRPPSPSAFVQRHVDRLDHLATVVHVEEQVAAVDLVVRPFRRDLLDRGSAVVDFAGRFLDAGDDPSAAAIRANERVPLELANLLRVAPKELRDGFVRTIIQEAIRGEEFEESAAIVRSHQVLHRFCHDRFEPGNLALIGRCGWPTDHFIEAPALDAEADLAELDELWQPEASATERQLLFRVVEELADARRRDADLRRRADRAEAEARRARSEAARRAAEAARWEAAHRALRRRRAVRLVLGLQRRAARVPRAIEQVTGRRAAEGPPTAPSSPAKSSPAPASPVPTSPGREARPGPPPRPTDPFAADVEPPAGCAHLVDLARLGSVATARSGVQDRVAAAIVDACDRTHLSSSLDDLLAIAPSRNLFQWDGHLVELATATRLTGDPAYLEHALRLLHAIPDVWRTIPQDRDLFPPFLLMSLATFADLLPDGADDERRVALRLVADMAAHVWDDLPRRDYADPGRTAWNHAIIVSGSLGVAGLVCDDHPDRRAWLAHGIGRTRSFLEVGLSPAGVTYEGLQYCGYVFRMLGALLCGARSVGLLDQVVAPGSEAEQRLRRVPAWYARSTWPRGSFLDNHNDSVANPHGPLYGFLRSFAALEPSLCALVWHNLVGDGGLGTLGAHPYMSSLVDSLLHLPDGDVDPAASAGLDLDLVDRAVGLVSARDRWGRDATVVTFTTGQAPCELHGQSDKGAVTFTVGGIPVLADSGAANDPREGSAGSSAGHNLVLVDGRGQRPAGGGIVVRGELLDVVHDDDHLALSSDSTDAYGQEGYNPVRHAVRHVVFVRGPLPYLLTVDDIDKDGEPHRYELLLHGHRGAIGEVGSSPTDRVVLGGHGLDPSRPVLAVRILHPGPVEVERTEQRAGLGPPGTHPVLRCAVEAVNPRFVLLHSPADGPDPDARVVLDGTTMEVRLTWPHGTDVIRFPVAPLREGAAAPELRRTAPAAAPPG